MARASHLEAAEESKLARHVCVAAAAKLPLLTNNSLFLLTVRGVGTALLTVWVVGRRSSFAEQGQGEVIVEQVQGVNIAEQAQLPDRGEQVEVPHSGEQVEDPHSGEQVEGPTGEDIEVTPSAIVAEACGSGSKGFTRVAEEERTDAIAKGESNTKEDETKKSRKKK
ncbi:hypothetical protein RIF29_31527 [Crotalaria pallida]|uniref:Uncharacterized protein n=1 Tax=Crotalaria pallida TaxID=3830 RepID=A0AAN9EHU8_CROPI